MLHWRSDRTSSETQTQKHRLWRVHDQPSAIFVLSEDKRFCWTLSADICCFCRLITVCSACDGWDQTCALDVLSYTWTEPWFTVFSKSRTDVFIVGVIKPLCLWDMTTLIRVTRDFALGSECDSLSAGWTPSWCVWEPFPSSLQLWMQIRTVSATHKLFWKHYNWNIWTQ